MLRRGASLLMRGIHTSRQLASDGTTIGESAASMQTFLKKFRWVDRPLGECGGGFLPESALRDLFD